LGGAVDGTYFYESEMALISEWMEQCGEKVLDKAGIVRDAFQVRLGPINKFSSKGKIHLW
jgi:hypothetical protein